MVQQLSDKTLHITDRKKKEEVIKMQCTNWRFTIAIILISLMLMPAIGYTSDYPNKAVSLICGFGAGGQSDLNTRAIAEGAKKHLGQPIIVENITGGGGNIGLGKVASARADGYTLGMRGPTLYLGSLMSKLSFNPRTDFTQIIQVCGNSFGILVRSDSPYKTLRDLISYAKANPGKLRHMSAGVGTGPYVIMTELEGITGAKFIHIPGKSDAEASTSLLGGHVDLIAGAMGSTTPLVQAGKIRLLATLGEERTKNFPEFPTVKELGYDVVYVAPLGILGPKGMDEKIVRTLHDAFKSGMGEEVFLSYCNKYAVPILYKNSADYKKYWIEECDRWDKFYAKYMKKN
jgi:tripartite-type tricarboxylate transporter receptor subunit TctC